MLRPSFTGWQAQYARLQRSYARVTGPYRSSVEYDDDLHHFIQDCWHLKDWIKNDPSTGLASSIETLAASYKSLRVAADLANGSKHLNRHTDREGAYVTSFGVTSHLGQDKPIEVECTVTLGDGTTMPISTLVEEAHRDWNTLLVNAGLIA